MGNNNANPDRAIKALKLIAQMVESSDEGALYWWERINNEIGDAIDGLGCWSSLPFDRFKLENDDIGADNAV